MTTTNWVPTARLAVALGRAGFRVEALCPSWHPLRRAVAGGVHTYEGLAPLRSLARAIAAVQPDLILPGDDLATSHLHELYRRHGRSRASTGAGHGTLAGTLPATLLEDLIERSLGSPEFFPVVRSRAAFMELAREEGIRVPETTIIQTDQELKSWIERTGLPTVLKADGTSGGEGVRVLPTMAEAQRVRRKLQAPPLLARALKRALFDDDRTLVWPSLRRQRPKMSAQAFVAGQEATSTVACWKGEVLASLHFEVLRKCSAAGHSTVVRWMENVEMSSAVERMVRRMNLSGICGFDFMLEASSGNPYLIEMNPRATQVGHLQLGEGRDLPAALYGAISGRPPRSAPAVTANDTIALFPHEWARDPHSEFLRTGYHDVPWDTPALVQAGIERSPKQSAWYSGSAVKREVAMAAAPPVKAAAENSSAARVSAR